MTNFVAMIIFRKGIHGIMVCSNCASQLPLDAKFCDNCGAKVDTFECPRVELVSSGPMKYKKTNLDIARLDLDSVRIDLNDKFSNYVIPAGDPFENVTENKKVENVQKAYSDPPKPAAEQMSYVKPQRAQVYANTAQVTDVRRVQNNANQSQRYNSANGSAPNAPRYNANNYPNMGGQSRPAMNQNYQQMQNRRYNANKQNSNNSNNDTNSSANGVVLFIISLVSMSFLGSPVLSGIISVIVMINTLKLDKTVKLKNTITGISLFVFVMSLFSILARIGV